MSRHFDFQTLLLSVAAAFYFAALGGYYSLVFRTNKGLAPEERLPYGLSLGNWRKLQETYRSFYPRGILYQFTLLSAVSLILLAAIFAAWRFSLLASGK
jgi:hypothetical protein